MTAARPRLLIVEDDPKTRETIRLYAEREGFECLLAADGIAGLRLAREGLPSLVVLDLMLPGADGFAVCRALRRETGVPIVMVTARGAEEDKLRGLADGADDYLTKPFSPRELMARVRSVLRRTAGEVGPAEQRLRGGRYVLDHAAERLLADGVEVRLSPTEHRLLALLARAPRVWSREEIRERLGDGDRDTADRTVDVHVRNLRKKLTLPGERPLVATVFGRGYRLDP
jgi:DNA-binding response OmpR family regulator